MRTAISKLVGTIHLNGGEWR